MHVHLAGMVVCVYQSEYTSDVYGIIVISMTSLSLATEYASAVYLQCTTLACSSTVLRAGGR